MHSFDEVPSKSIGAAPPRSVRSVLIHSRRHNHVQPIFEAILRGKRSTFETFIILYPSCIEVPVLGVSQFRCNHTSGSLSAEGAQENFLGHRRNPEEYIIQLVCSVARVE